MALGAIPVVANAADVQTISSDVLASGDGSEVKYSVGKLVPGTYKLSAKLTSKVYNVKINIGGTEKEIGTANNPSTPNVGIEFTLDKETDIELSLVSTDPGQAGAGFTVADAKIILDYNFDDIKNTLITKAGELANTIAGYDYDNYEDHDKQKDVEKANNLKTKAEGIAETYDDYKKFELYAKKSTIEKEIDALADEAAAVEADYQNEQAYNRVNTAITDIKAKYNAAVTELEGILVDAAAYLLPKANDELNTKINEKITTATSANYASYEAGKAVADETTNKALIPTEEALNAIVNDYKTQAADNKAAYETLTGKVTTLQNNLNAVTVADGSLTASFAEERAAAQKAIDDINAKVSGVYNKAGQLTLNIDADVTAAQGKITTLAGKVSTANTEYNANKATTEAIAAVQKAKDDAKAEVEKKVSKDGAYVAGDKYYADYLKTQQDAIDKLTKDAAAAYKVDGTGTAQTYNSGLEAKTAPITAAINAYKNNAPLAVDNYDARQADMVAYQDTLDKVREKVKDLAIYTAEAYDYETKLALLQKRIHEIEKAIEAAQEKKGAEHWADMLAIAADDKFIEDVTNLIASAPADQNQYDKDQLTADRTAIGSSISAFVATEAVLGADYTLFAAAETAIQGKFTQIETEWSAINVNADDAPATITALGKRITDLKAEQDALVATANAVKAKVAANTKAKDDLTASINNLQTTIGTFKTTYKVGQDDSTLGLRGKADGSVTTELNDIETKLGTLKTTNNSVVPTEVANVDIQVAGNEYSNLANGVYDIQVEVTAAAGEGKVSANATEKAYAASGTIDLTGVFVSNGTLKVSVSKEGDKVEVKKVTYHENDLLGKYNNADEEALGYNDQYSSLAERENKLEQDAPGIKTAVENNAATLTAANTAVANLQTAELNTLKGLENVTNDSAVSDDATAKKADPANWKVFESGLDADKTYTAKKAAIDADITAMSNAITASAAVEKLFDEWKDNAITVGEGDQAKTYSISAITDAINALKAEAAAESENWKAYNALQDVNMPELRPDTIQIDAAVMGEGAMNYYQGLKTQYINGKADIRSRMQADLNARKAVSTKTSFVTEITALINKVKAIYPDSKANKAKYDEQVAAYQSAQALWNKTYTDIAAQDKSSIVQDWLKDLDAIQVTLTEAKEAVEANYKIGKSVAEAKDFAAIEASIKDKKAQWSENYNEVIAGDNKVAHESFITAIDLAEQAYKDAVTDRAKYSSTNAELEGVITEVAAVLDVALYNSPTEIEKLRKEEGDAYAGTQSPDVFDVDDFNTRATAILTNITTELNKFKTDVKTAIENYWTPKKAGFAAQVTQAEAEINSYKDEAKQDAFKDVINLIAKGDAGVQSMTLSEVDDAINGSEDIPGLENINDMLTADKEAAAVKDINLWIADADAKYGEVKEYLESVTIADDVYYAGEQLGILEDGYWDVRYVKDLSDTYNFSNHNRLVNILNEFITKANNCKALVENAVVSDVANTAAYNEIAAAVAAAGEKLANAKDAAAPYKYATSFGTNEENLASIKSDAEYYKSRGSAVANKAALLNSVDALNAAIEATLTTAFGTEKTGLNADIAELKNQYNTYVANNSLEAAAGFKAKIDEYATALTNAAIADLDDPADGIQFDEIVAATEKLIELQNNIANLESELLEANASTANADVLAEFIGDLEELAASASLEDNADWVKQQPLNGKTLQQWVEEISAQIAELQEQVENEPNIAFYKKQYQEQITNIETALEPVVNKINACQAQFEANAEKYATLSSQLQELQDLVNAAKAKVGAYEYAYNTYKYMIESYSWYGLSGGVQYNINNAREELGYKNNDVALTASSNLNDYINVNNTKSTIQSYLDESAYTELTAQKNNLTMLLVEALDEENHFGQQKYSSALWARLTTLSESINGKITGLGGAIEYSHKTDKYYYKNGVRTYGISSDYDYASQMETVGTIKEEIENLGNAVDNMGLLGDANEDTVVNVLDYQTVVNMILNPDKQPAEGTNLFANIDINQNTAIEVGDLTAIVNYILNKEWADDYVAVKGFRTQSESMSMDITPVQQGVQRYAINLQNTEDYTAFQLDVVLPEGMTIVDQSLSNRAGQSHKLYSRTQQDGSVRLLASSVKGETFSGNEGAVLYIDVQTDASFQGGSVEVLNILFSDVYAGTHAFAIGNGGEATGIDIMAAVQSLKQKVYDLGGRVMNSMKKGVNIIQNADGTTKKVLK